MAADARLTPSATWLAWPWLALSVTVVSFEPSPLSSVWVATSTFSEAEATLPSVALVGTSLVEVPASPALTSSSLSFAAVATWSLLATSVLAPWSGLIALSETVCTVLSWGWLAGLACSSARALPPKNKLAPIKTEAAPNEYFLIEKRCFSFQNKSFFMMSLLLSLWFF